MSQEDSLFFIQQVQMRECLWNRRDIHYKNKIKQADAWASIGELMGKDPFELRQKWQSLQSSFRHFKGVYKSSEQTGSAAQPNRKKWFAYDAMSFMSVTNECGTTVDTLGSLRVMPTPQEMPSPEESLEIEWLYPENNFKEGIYTEEQTNPQTANETSPSSPANNEQTAAPEPPLPTITPHQQAGKTRKRRVEANLAYNEEVLQTPKTVSTVSQTLLNSINDEGSEEMRFFVSAAKEIESWSPKRRKGIVARVGTMISIERTARYEKYYNSE
ncbi:uncharacterized protein LOC120908258 [Anopheles arabiensis]|uniref:uncharacterized protein LOC120908258 n=1 Tax=Anopheles arabiensis TaxID=7173 RepID=UPI001AAD5673|nr:uncharacterized protein LOC120908258 [Anopheles arabiensis]